MVIVEVNGVSDVCCHTNGVISNIAVLTRCRTKHVCAITTCTFGTRCRCKISNTAGCWQGNILHNQKTSTLCVQTFFEHMTDATCQTTSAISGLTRLSAKIDLLVIHSHL